MNFRRGFFRATITISLLWVFVSTAFALMDSIYADSESSYMSYSSKDRVIIFQGKDFNISEAVGIHVPPKTNKPWEDYGEEYRENFKVVADGIGEIYFTAPVSVSEINAVVDVALNHINQWKWMVFLRSLWGIILPPLFFIAIFYILTWVFSGFRKETS